MAPAPPKMPAPLKLMEAVVGFLIPPACREHVLGDLHERYANPQQYVADAAHTVPCVNVSRIRRTMDPQVVLMEAFALYISFLAAAWRLLGVPFLSERSGFLRLAIPAGVALAALRLTDAYADPRKRSPLKPAANAAIGVAFAFLSQAVLSAANPEWLVPRWVMISGGGMSVLLVSTLRMLLARGGSLPQSQKSGGNSPMSQNDVYRKSQAFTKRARRESLSLLLGPLVVVLIALWSRKAVEDQPLVNGMAGGAIIAAVLYVIYQIYKRRPAGAVPPDATSAASLTLYRAQLESRRDALRGIWRWYVGPVLAAMMAFALRFPAAHPDQPRLWVNIAPFLVLSVVWSIAAAQQSQRAARKLQQEIDGLDGGRSGTDRGRASRETSRSEDSENHS